MFISHKHITSLVVLGVPYANREDEGVIFLLELRISHRIGSQYSCALLKAAVNLYRLPFGPSHDKTLVSN